MYFEKSLQTTYSFQSDKKLINKLETKLLIIKGDYTLFIFSFPLINKYMYRLTDKFIKLVTFERISSIGT